MKKFLYKLFFYLLFLVVLTLAFNLLYKHFAPSEQVRKVPDNIQICNFGSSHGAFNFNYTDLNKKYVCANFGMVVQTLMYDYRIMLHYKEKIAKDAVVFIILSHFSFFGKPEVLDDDFASLNRRYYKFLPRNLIKEYDLKTDIYINYFPLLSKTNILGDLFNMFFPPNAGLWIEGINAEKAKPHGYERYYLHVARKTDKDGSRMYQPEAIEALYNMISLCRDIGARPVLVTTPYLKEYTDAIREHDPSFYDDFYSVINEVTSKTGVEYYDYSMNKDYMNDYSLFTDTDHLNGKGSRLFTNELVSRVMGISIP